MSVLSPHFTWQLDYWIFFLQHVFDLTYVLNIKGCGFHDNILSSDVSKMWHINYLIQNMPFWENLFSLEKEIEEGWSQREHDFLIDPSVIHLFFLALYQLRETRLWRGSKTPQPIIGLEPKKLFLFPTNAHFRPAGLLLKLRFLWL